MPTKGSQLVREFIDAISTRANFSVQRFPLSRTKNVYYFTNGMSALLYLHGRGEPPYKWGVTKNVIQQLKEQEKPWAIVLLYDSIETGYLLSENDVEYYIEKNVWPLARDGDYKPAIGSYLSRNTPFKSFNEFINLSKQLLEVDSFLIPPNKVTSRKSTVEYAIEYGNLHGNKPYEEHARQILPILVRQAKATQTITYTDLANEVGMPNARNLNYPLGNIGGALIKLGEQWGEKIPPIQTLVINKATGSPGVGISDFLPDPKKYRQSSARERKILVRLLLNDVFTYKRWHEVLAVLGLQPSAIPTIKPSQRQEIIKRKYGSSGESADHKALKEYVSHHPVIVGLLANTPPGEQEYQFPSNDAVDVLFKTSTVWMGVEVKHSNSVFEDIARGLYQCVKYQALIEAVQMVAQSQLLSRTILVLGGKLPEELKMVKNILGIEVLENVQTS